MSPSPGSDATRGATPRDKLGGLDFDAHAAFCRQAEDVGVEQVLVPTGFQRAEPFAVAGALGTETSSLKFMIAARPGTVSPTYFVQQVNTLSVLTGGRVTVNAVMGHTPEEQRYYGDHLPHDERYRRAEEYYAICTALWDSTQPVDFAGTYYHVEGARLRTPFTSPDRARPEIYMSGGSPAAQRLAHGYADCRLMVVDSLQRLAEAIAPTLEQGIGVGLLASLIIRPTREEAVRAAEELVKAAQAGAAAQRAFRARSDSQGFAQLYETAESGSPWLGPHLWVGTVPYLGPPAASFVGSPEDIVEGLLAYAEVGVSQFVFQGRPDFEVVTVFGQEVLPRIRAFEAARAGTAGADMAGAGR